MKSKGVSALSLVRRCNSPPVFSNNALRGSWFAMCARVAYHVSQCASTPGLQMGSWWPRSGF